MRRMPPRLGSSWLLAAAAVAAVALPAAASDVSHQAAGGVSLGYVGLYYGLVDPNTGTWHEGEDLLFGLTSTTWLAVTDTGSSACILGAATQAAYNPSIPLQPYPDVSFVDEGFGGFEAFAASEPLRLMIAGQAAATDDTENHALYAAYAPFEALSPGDTVLAASLRDPSAGIDVDILGMSILEGRVLGVDPHHLDFLRLSYLTMAGSLDDTPPPPEHPDALYLPVELVDFFGGPQSVDVGRHPVLNVHLRQETDGEFATRAALFDTGSPVNFVSESFALAAGIDLAAPPDRTIPVGGIGSEITERPGWYVDALALDVSNRGQGNRLLVHNTAVFVVPDEDMPGGLDAILGNTAFSPSDELADTTIARWYVDTRDPNASAIVLVAPEFHWYQGDFNADDAVDLADIDLLHGLMGTTVGPGEELYDLVNDDGIDLLDWSWLIRDILGTSLADTNLDGEVGILDLGKLAAFYRRTGGFADGDTDGNGIINILDLGRLAGDYGKSFSFSPSLTPPAGTAAPEPAAALLLLAGLPLLGRRRRPVKRRPRRV